MILRRYKWTNKAKGNLFSGMYFNTIDVHELIWTDVTYRVLRSKNKASSGVAMYTGGYYTLFHHTENWARP